MLPWSDNIENHQPNDYKPKRFDPDDDDPKEQAFPYHPTLSKVNDLPFIEIVDGGAITFRMQMGPVKEVGVTGCQISDLIKVVIDTIDVFNKKFPCRENALTITKLEEAWLWLQARTLDREARSVEGLNKD